MESLTDAEKIDLAKRLVRGDVGADAVPWETYSKVDADEILALVTHWFRLRRAQQATSAAAGRRLLRSLLDRDQLAEYRRGRCVTVVGSTGGRYRLWPASGAVFRVERHGKRWYSRVLYCLHEPENDLPRADRSVAHLLILSTDEPSFLALANATPTTDQMWNGDYLRRMRAARRERQARLTLTIHEGAPQ